MIGHINLGMKQAGERNAGKPHVASTRRELETDLRMS